MHNRNLKWEIHGSENIPLTTARPHRRHKMGVELALELSLDHSTAVQSKADSTSGK